MSEKLDFAVDFAQRAGSYMQERRDLLIAVTTKPDGSLVTDVDQTINQWFINEVRLTYPDCGVIGEEQSLNPDADKKFIIDPLDGTIDYIAGGNTSTTGLVYVEHGRLILGVVNNPFHQETFTAERGKGAYINGYSMYVNRAKMARGVAHDRFYWEGALADTRVFEQQIGPRIGCESALYQACMVAQGKSAFSVFPGRAVHDVAPGAIIVQEAGGAATDIHGNELTYNTPEIPGAILSNGVIHQAVLATLRG